MNQSIKRILLASTIPTVGLLLSGCLSDKASVKDKDEDGGSTPSVSASLSISEVVAKAADDGNDWIELNNTGDTEVNLSNYALNDAESDPASLPEVVLQPGEYYVIQATDEPVGGEPSVPFKLGKEDSLTLTYNGEEVSAIAWSDGDAPSKRSYGVYNGVNQTLHPTPGASNAPHNLFLKDEVVTVKLNMSTENWQAILANPLAEEYQAGSIEFNGIELDNVAIRVKGQTSLQSVAGREDTDPSAHRFSFKVDINKYEEQKFLGSKKLVFNNSFSDPSMMRDVIAYELMDDAGIASPQIAYVDLWVAGEHLGLYNIVEAIDGEFIEDYFPDDKEEAGDLYKAEMNATLSWVDDNIFSYHSPLELKNNEDTLDTELEGLALITMLDSLNNSDSPLDYIDIPSTLRYFAANTLVANMDSYVGSTAHNYYLYEQRSNYNKFSLLPWDYNLSMGSFGSCDGTTHLIDEPTEGAMSGRPLVEKLFKSGEYADQYHGYVQELIDGPFSVVSMNEKIDRIAALIAPYVEADPTKFSSYEIWQTSLVSAVELDYGFGGGGGGGGFGGGGGGFGGELTDEQREAICNGEIPDFGGDAPVGGGQPTEGLAGGGVPDFCSDGDSELPEGELPEGELPEDGLPGGGFGSGGTPGLKEFIQARVSNVQQQLNGEIPSASGGAGACPSTTQE